VTLVEQAPEPRTGGYVIDFGGLGYDVAEKMGVLDELRRHDLHVQEFRIVDRAGRRISGFNQGAVREFIKGRGMSLPFVHTIVTAIPREVTGIAEGVLAEGLQHPGVFGRGTLGGRGYRGPSPVRGHGPHSYAFQLFALAAPLPGDRSVLSRARMAKAMAGLVLARGRLDGTYEQ
jgi:hypothetical protein